MGKTYENRMDADFARRLLLSAVASLAIGALSTFLVLVPLANLFDPDPGLGFLLIVMANFSIIIAVVADRLRLAPFPLIEILRGNQAPAQRAAAMEQIRHTAHALPFSFAASSIWALLLFDAMRGTVPIIVILAMIPPATIMALIVSMDCSTPRQALRRSSKGFIVVLAAMFLIAPGLGEREGASEVPVETGETGSR